MLSSPQTSRRRAVLPTSERVPFRGGSPGFFSGGSYENGAMCGFTLREPARAAEAGSRCTFGLRVGFCGRRIDHSNRCRLRPPPARSDRRAAADFGGAAVWGSGKRYIRAKSSRRLLRMPIVGHEVYSDGRRDVRSPYRPLPKYGYSLVTLLVLKKGAPLHLGQNQPPCPPADPHRSCEARLATH